MPMPRFRVRRRLRPEDPQLSRRCFSPFTVVGTDPRATIAPASFQLRTRFLGCVHRGLHSSFASDPPSSIGVLLATTPWSAVGPYRSDARDAPAPSWASQLKSASLTTTRSRATGTAAGARGGTRVFRVGGGAGAFHA